jgi:hypothetical protein
MRRPVLIVTLLAALLVPAAAADARRGVKRVADVPLASATLDDCVTAAAPLSRYATFTGQMSAIEGSARMALRLDLYVHAIGRRGWDHVQAPGLGRWVHPEPGVDIYRSRKQVMNLSSPAAYRAVVRFAWLDSDGSVILRQTRRTQPCHQPDQRPDLVISDVAVRPGSEPGLGRSIVTVRNAGEGDAGPFGVAVRVGRDEHQVGVVGLAPGRSRDVELLAPVCRAERDVRATVDPDGLVDESAEGNNALRVGCPPYLAIRPAE